MASLSQLLYEVRRIEKSREVLTEKKIQSIYRSLMDDLYGFLGKNYANYADTDGRLYLAYLDAQNKRAKFLQEIVKNVDNISPDVKKEITTLIDKTYSESYKGMINAVKTAKTSKEIAELVKDIDVNPNVLRQAMKNNISKLTLDPVMEKHRQELVYQLQQELNIGLMNGDRYDTMAKRISERLGVSYSKASNIVKTESHRNIESGMIDGAKELEQGLDDSDLIYAATWRTMKDERVRPNRRVKTKHGWKIEKGTGANHQKMEGVTIKVGEKFQLEPGVETECPGQSGVARHDCRCRCYLEYNLMTVEEFAAATGKTVEEVQKKINKVSAENNRQKTIEDIRGKQIWDGISESDRDAIVNYLRDGDENTLMLINDTIDKVSVDWKLNESGTSNYSTDTGKITIRVKDNDNVPRSFWHEYGHFLDDVDTSGIDIRYERTYTHADKVDTIVFKGTTSKARETGYADAAVKDVEKLLNDSGLSDKYYAKAVSKQGCSIYRKNDDTVIDTLNDFEDMDVLQKAMQRKFDDCSGLTKARNYLKDMGYPDEPVWDDYYEVYITPKRGIAKTREKYKGAGEDYIKAMQVASEAREKFASTHDLYALAEEQERLRKEAERIERKLGTVSDTIDGASFGAFMCSIALGGHSASYYQIGSRGIEEGVANVFMANATGDKDTIKAMKVICPEIYKVITEAWKVGG
jgi:uncharacterized protein with gpF-like domain